MKNEEKQRIDLQMPSEQLPLSSFKVKRIKTALLLRHKKLSLLRNIFAALLLLGAIGILFAFYRSGGSIGQSITAIKERMQQNYSPATEKVISQSLKRMSYYSSCRSKGYSETAIEELKEAVACLDEKVNHSLKGINSNVLFFDIEEKLQYISSSFSEVKYQWQKNSALFSPNTSALRNNLSNNTMWFVERIGELVQRMKDHLTLVVSQLRLKQ